MLHHEAESSWHSSENFQGTGLWMTTGVSLLHIPLKSKQGTLYIRDSRGNKEERKEEREEQGEKRKVWERERGNAETVKQMED